MDRANQIFTQMNPEKEYRSSDFAGIPKSTAKRVLDSLWRGNMVDRARSDSRGCPFVYRTKQNKLI